MRTSLKFTAVGACVVAALAMTTTPASAAATAYHIKDTYFAANPANDPGICFAEYITLDHGNYTWDAMFDGIQRERTITLNQATYTWEDCVTPTYDPNSGDWYYYGTSTLSNSYYGYYSQINYSTWNPTDATLEWGSELTPNF